MTRQEIVKALRCCKFGEPCDRCPVVSDQNCMNVMHKRAADLIERLTAERGIMPPKENLERACEECIHFFACSRQCGEPMAQRSATGCECYETVKSSMAYYVGTLDGAKGKIPNRLRELAEADKDGRVVVLPCKVYETDGVRVYEHTVREVIYETAGGPAFDKNAIGKSIFLTREEAERASRETQGKEDADGATDKPE